MGGSLWTSLLGPSGIFPSYLARRGARSSQDSLSAAALSPHLVTHPQSLFSTLILVEGGGPTFQPTSVLALPHRPCPSPRCHLHALPTLLLFLGLTSATCRSPELTGALPPGQLVASRTWGGSGHEAHLQCALTKAEEGLAAGEPEQTSWLPQVVSPGARHVRIQCPGYLLPLCPESPSLPNPPRTLFPAGPELAIPTTAACHPPLAPAGSSWPIPLYISSVPWGPYSCSSTLREPRAQLSTQALSLVGKGGWSCLALKPPPHFSTPFHTKLLKSHICPWSPPPSASLRTPASLTPPHQGRLDKTTSGQPLGHTGRPSWPPGSRCPFSVRLVAHTPPGLRGRGPGAQASAPPPIPTRSCGHIYPWLCTLALTVQNQTARAQHPNLGPSVSPAPWLTPDSTFRGCLSPRCGEPTPPRSEWPPPTNNRPPFAVLAQPPAGLFRS